MARQNNKKNNSHNKNKNTHKHSRPERSPITALYADAEGEIFDAPGIGAVGRTGDDLVAIQPGDLIPLPDTADLMFLPERYAVGIDESGELVVLEGRAVAAILPAGYTRTMLPGFEK